MFVIEDVGVSGVCPHEKAVVRDCRDLSRRPGITTPLLMAGLVRSQESRIETCLLSEIEFRALDYVAGTEIKISAWTVHLHFERFSRSRTAIFPQRSNPPFDDFSGFVQRRNQINLSFENECSVLQFLCRVGDVSAANGSDHDYRSQDRIDYYALARTYGPSVSLALILCGVFVSGLKLSFKGLDGGTDLALFGGWAIAAAAAIIGTLWFIFGHFPISFSENVSTAVGIDASATCNSRAENVCVLPIVVSELKFRNVERHVFPAHLVERPNRGDSNSMRSIDQTEPTASPPGLTRWSMVTSGV
jgi:hypothetical protein